MPSDPLIVRGIDISLMLVPLSMFPMYLIPPQPKAPVANKLTVSGSRPTVTNTENIPSRHLFTDADGDLHLKAGNAGYIRLTYGKNEAAFLSHEDTDSYSPYTDLGPIEIER